MKKHKHLVEPTFLRKSDYSYVNYNGSDLDSILSFSIGRNNGDLILHQQRIEVYARDNNPELLFGAIVDLFIALGDKGLDYKKRILDSYGHLLPSNKTMTLTRSMNSVLKDSTVIKELKGSFLSLGLVGALLSSAHLSEIK
ncbi:MAG: hypothetical protein KDI59_02760 [Xanthomonadales bacterium]|nr:hypothetical protein [Xanthomonadales bacterium]